MELQRGGANPTTQTAGAGATARLVRLRSNFNPIDTGATFRTVGSFNAGPEILDSIGGSRALWAVGSDWRAVNAGNSQHIEIQRGELVTRIDWPPGTSGIISRSDRVIVARWLGTYTVMFDPNAARVSDAMSKNDCNNVYEYLRIA